MTLVSETIPTTFQKKEVKKMKRTTLLRLSAGAALAMLMLIGGWQIMVSAQDAGKEGYEDLRRRTIEGVWRNQITIRNCQTGAPIRTFPGLLTFHKGGTLSETAEGQVIGEINPAGQLIVRSPGHGLWERRGWRHYQGSFTSLQYNSANRTFAGTVKITQDIELSFDGNSFNDTATIQIFAPNGTQVATACATAVGTRIEL